MLTLGVPTMARYPFVVNTGEYIKGTSMSLEALCSQEFRPVHEMAYERIVAAIDGTAYSQTDNDSHEIFAFLVSGIMLRAAGAPTVTNRYALAEARKAERNLESDLINAKDRDSKIKSTALAIKIIKDLTGVEIEQRPSSDLPGRKSNYYFYTVPIPTYLKRAAGFHAKEWKLINREVQRGLVWLTAHEAVRLVRDELARHIRDRISKAPETIAAGGLQGYVENIAKLEIQIAPKQAGKFTGKFPPCMIISANTLKSGENLSHSGRLSLGAFLRGVGKTQDEIVEYYRNAPDFNERITRAQVKSIFTGGAEGKGYSCYSCESMDRLGLCHRTDECGSIRHPLQFRSRS